MDLKEAYLEMQKASGIEVGDKVKVLRKAINYEMGWINTWTPDMDGYIGKVCEVIECDGITGICLDNKFRFPFFVLEIVEKKPQLRKLTLDDIPEAVKISCRDKYIKMLDKGMFDRDDWSTCEMCRYMNSYVRDCCSSCDYCPLYKEWCTSSSYGSKLSGFRRTDDLDCELTLDWSEDISDFINMLNQSIVKCRKYD